ncbi:hypothetical protein MWU76_04490 [Gelidibacter sp. F2691]|nr:hypothetical protein [Gelidibacter sp. F2691]
MIKINLEIIKSFIRFFYYKNERKKVFREPRIKRTQNELLKKDFNLNTYKLIVFLVDGADWFTGKDKISGGILSIASIFEETIKLGDLHKSEVIMVSAPNAHLLLRHKEFPNTIDVFRFEQLRHFKNIDDVLVHIPEFKFNEDLVEAIGNVFEYMPRQNIHLNILNQRIDIMPEPFIINNIKNKGYYLTQTTAHDRYSNKEIRLKFGIPLHKFSVYASPERYKFSTWKEKENLILISPDQADLKQTILDQLKIDSSNFEIKIIQDITYINYLDLIQRAKYMITFGEGLDFYFVETVFSGAVSFAVYNDAFFTEDFKSVPGVFENYEQMSKMITYTIENLENNNKNYIEVNKKQFDACHKIYNGTDYKENLINFYNKNYLLP